MNRQGPGPQSMRTLGFTNAAASRLPNGKLGPGWGPPGVPNLQSRQSISLSFSQSVSGLSQPATPLDLSEFPALGPQGQTQNAQAWNRITTQSPSQGRPTEDIFQSHINMEDFRLSGQQQTSQMHTSNSLDDFPALPRTQNGGHLDLGQSEASHAQHQLARNAFMSGGMTSLGGQQQNQQQQQVRQQPQSAIRQSLASPQSIQNVGGPQASRLLPLDVMQSQQNVVSLAEQEKKGMKPPNSMAPSNGAPGLPLNLNSSNLSQASQNQHQSYTSQNPLGQLQQATQQQPIQHQQHQQQQQKQQQNHQFQGGNITLTGPLGSSRPQTDFGELTQATNTNMNNMNLSERYGLTGLLGMIRGDNQDLAMLALGTDLTQLGFDLNQPDSSNVPLWAGFASPWADPESKPIEPEFSLPSCYSVSNIQPLHAKVQNFSDETLFYIFYTMPQDIMQEIVASELTSRNWRYHTGVRLWLTKEPGSTPTQLSETSEKGSYIFFDPSTWERVRKEWVLDYSQLDARSLHQA